MSDDIDIDTLRKKLAARRDVALARLHDTVRELYAVHAVSADEIRAILEATFRVAAGCTPSSRSPTSDARRGATTAPQPHYCAGAVT
jgi:hypothetical protein